MKLSSEAVSERETIPRKYTADGDNVSPPVAWSDVPSSARELVLVLEDVKTTGERRFTHWVVYHIPPDLRGLPEDLGHRREVQVPDEVAHGKNSQGNIGYDGPSPPMGSRHRYHLRLLALDRPLDLEPGADRQALDEAIEGHVIDEAEVEAIYERPRA